MSGRVGGLGCGVAGRGAVLGAGSAEARRMDVGGGAFVARPVAPGVARSGMVFFASPRTARFFRSGCFSSSGFGRRVQRRTSGRRFIFIFYFPLFFTTYIINKKANRGGVRRGGFFCDV